MAHTYMELKTKKKTALKDEIKPITQIHLTTNILKRTQNANSPFKGTNFNEKGVRNPIVQKVINFPNLIYRH